MTGCEKLSKSAFHSKWPGFLLDLLPLNALVRGKKATLT
jgi:hypothetical protein